MLLAKAKNRTLAAAGDEPDDAKIARS